MRKIKFRGKRKDNGKFVYGDYCSLPNSNIVFVNKNNEIDCEMVIPYTVGQFTGLTDKNGKEIYEGDIIEDNNGIGVVMWFQTAWGVASYAYGYDELKSYIAVDSFYSNKTKEWTVIGNIHDNPELITNKE